MKPIEILAHLATVGTPPDAPSALEMAVGLDGYTDHLSRETLPFLTGGGCELQFVYGQYGRGKTHFLQTIRELARCHGFVTAYVDCRMGQSPFKSLQETYRMIAQAMTAPEENQDSRYTKGVAGVIRQALLLTDNVSNQLHAVRAHPGLVSDYRNLVYAFANNAASGETHLNLGEALTSLLNADSGYAVRVGSLYRDHPHLPRPIGKIGRRNAAAWLRSLLSLPWALGYPGLILLFDETERGHSFSSRMSVAQQLHLANLRNFVDHMAVGAFQGVSIHYAVVEDFIELARERLEALSQRIERVRVDVIDSDGILIGNPRAVWVSLDELTQPSPQDTSFFLQLGAKIIDIGCQAGLSEERIPPLKEQFSSEAPAFAESIFEGAVREYVKLAAASVAREVVRRD